MPAVLSASTNMQSLLSPSESNAFQSFLSSIDYTEDAIPADEWVAFSASSTSVDPSYSDDNILLDSIQSPEDRQALTKATKDLMSLDTSSWNSPNDTSMMNHSPVIHPNFDDHETQVIHQGHRDQHHIYQQGSSTYDSFPFLHTKSRQQQQPMQYPMQLQHHPISPLTGSPSDLQQRSPISPHSPYGFSQQPQLHQVHMPQHERSRGTSPGTRPKHSHIPPSVSPSSDFPHKRQRLSPSERHSSTPATTSSPGHSPPISQPAPQHQLSTKPSLLSPSQKKANHIQSEQKRRANIRKGYAALCETVPALREAIREEEEAERIAAAGSNTTAIINGDGVSTDGTGKKKKSKKSVGVNGKDPDDKDKDGRAGPKSENMVLSKTIEHIQHLLTERSSLLTRLQHARASLPSGHPALATLNPDPPWEREWKGSEGNYNFGDGDGDGDEGYRGCVDEEEDG